MKRRIGMIGYGAMGQKVSSCLADSSICIGAVLDHSGSPHAPLDGVVHCADAQALLNWQPDLVVECASHAAVSEIVPHLLENGCPVVIMSVGALADRRVHDLVIDAAARGGSRAIFASGAIGGIDALRAARIAGLDRVSYIGRKPPAAWLDTPAEKVTQLSSLAEAALIFNGNASEAARLYPKNANVTATVALAGLGFERTNVKLFADPHISRNIHEIEAHGAFGEMKLVLSNNPFPDNPKTSMLSALSAAHAIISMFAESSR